MPKPIPSLAALISSLMISGGAMPQSCAPIEQHFAPAEDLERIDVAEIAAAGETIDIAAYVLTDRAVIAALTAAAERGVRVRVYHDHEARLGDVAALATAGAALRAKPAGSLMHLKAYCVDRRVLRIGAANFSRSGLTEQDNDIEIIRGPAACAAFAAKFEQMWSSKP